jgi:2,5-dichloro-2,5-cyclohexadiene-1,4-diol dehydrogenase 1
VLKEKSIIITGGGSGIGAAAAVSAARCGARVTIADLDVEGGNAVATLIQQSHGEAQFIKTDIADEGQVQNLVHAALTRFGALHGAFNNAGIPSYSHTNEPSLLADLPLSGLRRNIEINFIGTFLCLKYEIKAMLETGGGAIVNTASNAGVLAIPSAADYIATKHAVIGLTKAAALDYAKQKIRVNAILPGITRSKMIEGAFAKNPDIKPWAESVQPNGRIGEPNEVGDAALWLLSDAASFVTGISMHVDGGYSIV